MRKILGLDIGTTSIGWAYVKEAETNEEKSLIEKLGVRVIPLTTDEETDFKKGKSISIAAERTLKRGARRNLDRYQLRRNALINILKENDIIDNNSILSEDEKNSTFRTYKKRAKAVQEKISKEDFAKVLLMINKKRGYKSNRKTNSDEEGAAIDGMEVAKRLYDKNVTPGQYVYELLKNSKKQIPDFYRSDLQNEFNKIWIFQKQFHPDILTDEFKEQIYNKGKKATSAIFLDRYKIYTAENKKTTTNDPKLQAYKWRNDALTKQLSKEEIAYVLAEINNNINASSGYLGEISDRSKKLFFNRLTVGEYLYNQLKQNPHAKIKNQVFYRQDYLDEFETIWEKQKDYYPELTSELKKEIRDVIIFYQRPLKSQKGLLSYCEFESWEQEIIDKETGQKKNKIVGHKVIPKSSPLFQEFKIWQNLNNIQIVNIKTGEYSGLDLESKELLFSKLNMVNKLTDKECLKLLVNDPQNYKLNFEQVEGNRTNAELYKVFQKILELEGSDYDFLSMDFEEVQKILNDKSKELGITQDLLTFNSTIEGDEFDKQPIIQLWHLLYSAQEDDHLINKISEKFGFSKKHAKLFTEINLQADYGNLSARAIRKILPYLEAGHPFSAKESEQNLVGACELAGYNHSASSTKEEQAKKELKNHLELLPKNSLRNPIVEKILNQMVNVVNAIIDDEDLGRPDEIRVELARELKKNADERKKMTQSINDANKEHERIRTVLQKDFGIKKVTRNDIIRYKLWKELENYGFKTIYTNTYIAKEELFSNKFDVEHIIPQSKIFDDSFSNKTLALRDINIEKGNQTAYDYLKKTLSYEEFEQYLNRIENMVKSSQISRAKYNKLKMKAEDIPDGFIERDLRNSQYIAKKATNILAEVTRKVNTTTGKVTDRLRSDWQLINVLKELNLPKYKKLGLVKKIEGKTGTEEQIIDWSKRNDHRHHAMDALTVAFTTYSHVQYLNYMNARNNEQHKFFHEVYGIERKYLYRDEQNKLLFKPPLPIKELRVEAKKHLENILVSFKAKNKVVTRNKNKIKVKNGFKEKIELTPRGQLHKETVYGRIKQYVTKEERIGAKFDEAKIRLVANKTYRMALLKRLNEFDGDSKRAFGGKNSPAKNPIFIDDDKILTVPEKVKLVWEDHLYTIRKEISPDLKLEKVIDAGIRKILQKRLDEFKGDASKAFSNLDENPIWINESKGIPIKRATISGVSNAEALHYKKDHNGDYILDEYDKKQAIDFVSTGNNHHVSIYRDKEGNLQEEVVSFYEAVHRVNAGLPVIDKHKDNLEFLFSIKQNEYFVFPNGDFDPNEIDLTDPQNNSIISPNLFRVQKIATKDYTFRHHLESQLIDKKETTGFTYKRIRNISKIIGSVKVRINHLGKIVHVGEY